MNQKLQNIKLCLASASPRRLTLLQQVGITAHPHPTHLDESRLKGEKITHYVERLARSKASQSLCQGFDLVLAADTIVVAGNQVMGKPKDAHHARQMLQRLSGRGHKVITAIAVLRPSDGLLQSRIVTTRVNFKKLGKKEIRDYVASGEPLDKAGGYGIQGLGALLVARVNGSYSGVVGLPLTESVELLTHLAKSIKKNP